MNRRTIFWLWLPLALSFTLMMLEGPTIQSAIARLPDPALSLAAFGLMLGISLIIESPVIMLVSTAIALATDAQSYRALRRFMITLNLGLTLLTAAVAFTPLFDVISRYFLGMPEPIVVEGRPAMQVMLFWTAAIGWRRFYQGILVRYGQSRRVTYGTAVRLVATILIAVALVLWGRLSGAVVGALSLMTGVLVEAAVTHVMAIGVVRDKILPNNSSDAAPLSQRQILRFHAPLAGTSLLNFVIQPVTAAALARLSFPRETLAAWPVVFSTLLVLRGWGMALQETTIAQARDERMRQPLRDFTLIVAGTLTAATVALAFTPLLEWHLRSVIGLEAELRGFVRTGVQLSLLVPAFTALTSWLRGMMVASQSTEVVYRGMLINVVVNCAGLALGVFFEWPGIPVAALALTLALLVEYGYLLRRTRRTEQPAMVMSGQLA